VKTAIKRYLTGAALSTGVVVVIDVFRSSNTILMLLTKGASAVIPVATVKEAFELKNRYPHRLLAGERKGITVRGFDMGNSPYEVSNHNVQGKEVILTTSAGTQGMTKATKAKRMFVGSFGNAGVLIEALKAISAPLVTFLAVGTDGIRKAAEDELCASYLQRRLQGGPKDVPATLTKKILRGEGAERLRLLKQENDFSYCLAVDIFNSVPEIRREKEGLKISTVKFGAARTYERFSEKT
jgi:2-phosphosulfolactate phosphatase